MQRGFIQIPILIVLIIGIFAISGTGYIAYHAGKSASHTSSPAVASSTESTHLTTTTSTNKRVDYKSADTSRCTAEAKAVFEKNYRRLCLIAYAHTDEEKQACSLFELADLEKDQYLIRAIDPSAPEILLFDEYQAELRLCMEKAL
jgi:uncharacterized protein YkuJ